MLKKKSGITHDEYMKMDKTDLEHSRNVAGFTKEEAAAVWEKLPDHEYLEMMRKARAKHGV